MSTHKPSNLASFALIAIFALAFLGASCSQIQNSKATPVPTTSLAIDKELENVFEVGTTLYINAENSRVMTDPVSEKFPGGGSAERQQISANQLKGSKLYQSGLKQLSKRQSSKITAAVERLRRSPQISTWSDREILDLVKTHALQMKRGGINPDEWEQDYRTLYFKRPASQDPAIKRSDDIILGR